MKKGINISGIEFSNKLGNYCLIFYLIFTNTSKRRFAAHGFFFSLWYVWDFSSVLQQAKNMNTSPVGDWVSDQSRVTRDPSVEGWMNGFTGIKMWRNVFPLRGRRSVRLFREILTNGSFCQSKPVTFYLKEETEESFEALGIRNNQRKKKKQLKEGWLLNKVGTTSVWGGGCFLLCHVTLIWSSVCVCPWSPRLPSFTLHRHQPRPCVGRSFNVMERLTRAEGRRRVRARAGRTEGRRRGGGRSKVSRCVERDEERSKYKAQMIELPAQ